MITVTIHSAPCFEVYLIRWGSAQEPALIVSDNDQGDLVLFINGPTHEPTSAPPEERERRYKVKNTNGMVREGIKEESPGSV